jgi:hypothetical protein
MSLVLRSENRKLNLRAFEDAYSQTQAKYR